MNMLFMENGSVEMAFAHEGHGVASHWRIAPGETTPVGQRIQRSSLSLPGARLSGLNMLLRPPLESGRLRSSP